MPRIGDLVDRYEICGEIDSGGMSVIYAVKRVGGVGGWSKLLAMKVILPNLARQERFATMFMDEARILSIIQHPNVVQVYDVGETDAGLLYMVMELLRGRSLARLIREAMKADGALDRGLLLGVLADVAEGLHAAHETRMTNGKPARIVHRDISPQNIHVGFDGSVKVVDFGIAAAEGRMSDTRTGELKGKLSYVAPEQVLRAERDHRVDLWSLGVVAWEVLAGRRLFTGDNEIETLRNVDSMEVPPILSLSRGLPAITADVIMGCLQRDPASRPASAAVVATAFREGSRLMAAAAGDTSDPLSRRRAYVQRLLGTEMIIENERLAVAVSEGPPPRRLFSPEEEISDPFRLDLMDEMLDRQLPPEPTPAPRRRIVVAAAAAIMAATLGALGLLRVAREDSPAPIGPVSVARPSPPAPVRPLLPVSAPVALAAPAPVPAEDRVVQLVLDPRIRMVRVDGRAVEERPVRVHLAAAPVVVEGLGAEGERVRRVLDAESPDHVALALPRAGGHGRGAPGKSPLLESPYRRGGH